jgi:hypothetical protein
MHVELVTAQPGYGHMTNLHPAQTDAHPYIIRFHSEAPQLNTLQHLYPLTFVCCNQPPHKRIPIRMYVSLWYPKIWGALRRSHTVQQRLG